jgi:hypothetical protein
MYAIRATYLPRDNMHFDRDYYVTKHISLAKKLLEGRIEYVDMYAELDSRDLMQSEVLRSPCVMNLLLETEEDVNKFKAFMDSEDVIPLAQDAVNYTNCEAQWTIAEVAK